MEQPAQQQVEHGREPCPDRILDDIGGAFGMGALGGGLWHTYRGLKNSPKGYKLKGTIEVTAASAQGPGGASQAAARLPQAIADALPPPMRCRRRCCRRPRCCWARPHAWLRSRVPVPAHACPCYTNVRAYTMVCTRRPSGESRPG